MTNRQVLDTVSARFDLVWDYEFKGSIDILCDEENSDYCMNSCPFSGELCSAIDGISESDFREWENQQ